jgi:hypothetical protein
MDAFLRTWSFLDDNCSQYRAAGHSRCPHPGVSYEDESKPFEKRELTSGYVLRRILNIHDLRLFPPSSKIRDRVRPVKSGETSKENAAAHDTVTKETE